MPVACDNQARGEEIANSVTHAWEPSWCNWPGRIGRVRGLKRNRFSCGGLRRLCVSLVLLYLCSTVYHALENGRAKRLFRILDHAPSTYSSRAPTRVHSGDLEGSLGMALFGVVWTLAVLGIVFKCFFTESCTLCRPTYTS